MPGEMGRRRITDFHRLLTVDRGVEECLQQIETEYPEAQISDRDAIKLYQAKLEELRVARFLGPLSAYRAQLAKAVPSIDSALPLTPELGIRPYASSLGIYLDFLSPELDAERAAFLRKVGRSQKSLKFNVMLATVPEGTNADTIDLKVKPFVPPRTLFDKVVLLDRPASPWAGSNLRDDVHQIFKTNISPL
jgi:hypothetical protein